MSPERSSLLGKNHKVDSVQLQGRSIDYVVFDEFSAQLWSKEIMRAYVDGAGAALAARIDQDILGAIINPKVMVPNA